VAGGLVFHLVAVFLTEKRLATGYQVMFAEAKSTHSNSSHQVATLILIPRLCWDAVGRPCAFPISRLSWERVRQLLPPKTHRQCKTR